MPGGSPPTPMESSPADERAVAYRIDFTQNARPDTADELRFTQTRWIVPGEGKTAGSIVPTGSDTEPDADRPVARFILDTEQGSAQPSGTIVRTDVKVGAGSLIADPVIQYNRFRDGYRVFFDVEREGGRTRGTPRYTPFARRLAADRDVALPLGIMWIPLPNKPLSTTLRRVKTRPRSRPTPCRGWRHTCGESGCATSERSGVSANG